MITTKANGMKFYEFGFGDQTWSRTSKRDYTHVLVFKDANESHYREFGYCGSLKLAQAKRNTVQAQAQRAGISAQLFIVDLSTNRVVDPAVVEE